MSVRSVGLLAGVAVAALALGLGSASPQTLQVVRALDAPHYDPHKTSSGATGEAMFLMGDTLTALGYDYKTIYPLLAKSWDISEDGRTYTFHLRDDVTFCSGKKLTAEDVKYSFDRLLGKTEPAVNSPFAWRAGDVKEIRVVDDHTLEYELNEPFGELLMQLSMWHATIVNRENVEKLGEDFGVNGFDGTGPWCWDVWDKRDKQTMTRHDAYKWGPELYENRGPVHFENMIQKTVPEEGARVAAMLAGQADIDWYLPYSAMEQMKAMPHLRVQEPETYLRTFYFGFKLTRDKVNDEKVRKAMNMAVNRQEIADAIFFGYAVPASTYIRPETPDFKPGTEEILARYDPEAAGKLLDEAGWKLRDDGFRYNDAGEKLSILMYGFAAGKSPPIMDAVQGYLRQVGVELNQQLLDSKIIWSKLREQDSYHLYSMAYPYLSAGDALSLYWDSANIPSPNRMNWDDPETDQLLAQGKAALTPEERAEAFGKIQEKVTDAAAWIPLVHEGMVIVTNQRLKETKMHGIYGAPMYKGLDLQYAEK